MTKLADDKLVMAGGSGGKDQSSDKRTRKWGRFLLAFWVILTGLWLGSLVLPWQFSMQTAAYRTHLYMIDGTLYWQHEVIHHAHASTFIKFGLLSHGRLLAAATRLLIVTNGLGAIGGGTVGLRGLVYSWNPLAGSGLWLSPLVLGLVLIGPLAWWLARRSGRRKASVASVRTA